MVAIKFNKLYDGDLLVSELESVFDDHWVNHFNTRDFDGQWKSISLRSATGKSDDVYANYTDEFKDTPLLANLPYISSILEEWKCEKETIRFMALYPGSEIKAHKDPGSSYADGRFRLHIPILTNPSVDFTVEGINHELAVGSCWYMDFGKVHSVKNAGNTVRVHLVIDCLQNSWTDKIFAESGYIEEEVKIPIEEVRKIIAQLETHETETASNLIAQLKIQHGIS